MLAPFSLVLCVTVFASYGAVSQLVTLSKYFIASLSPAGFGG